MSFLDKLTDAAKQAKQALDEAKEVLESVSGDDDAASAEASSAEAGRRMETGRQTTGMEAPLTLDEVREITGIDFDHFYDGDIAEEWASRTFNFADASDSRYFELRTAKAVEGVEFDADDMWNFLNTEVTPQEPVEGVAPGAFRSAPDLIYFRVGNRVMHTAAHLADETGDLVEELATRAAVNARSL